MKTDQPDHRGNVIPFRTRSGGSRAPLGDVRSDNILRMLDLSKFEQDRRTAGRRPNMRENIAAMILLGLLVIIATEDLSRLEHSNLCTQKWECSN